MKDKNFDDYENFVISFDGPMKEDVLEIVGTEQADLKDLPLIEEK